MMMRLIAGLVAILPAIVIFVGVIASAETPRQHALVEALGIKQMFGWPPNAADVPVVPPVMPPVKPPAL